MLNDPLHVAGTVLMLLGAVVWIAGASVVKRQHLRRMGEEALLFDPSQWSAKNFNDRERRGRLGYWLLACLLASAGLMLLRHAWT